MENIIGKYKPLKQLSQKFDIFFSLVVPDPYRKSILVILFEYFKCLVLNKNHTEQYFYKYVYHKGSNKIKNFLVTQNLMNKCWNLNDQYYADLIDNKYDFANFFSNQNISVVKNLAFINEGVFNFNKNSFYINSPNELASLLFEIARKNNKVNGFFIKKAFGSYGGSNIFKISKVELINCNGKLDKVYEEVKKSLYIFQNIVVQHEKMNHVSPGCVNTIRMDTYTNKNKVPEIFSSFLRIGLNKSHVDNISCGGIFVGIDIENGVLFPNAFQDFQIGRGRKFFKHPETNFVFEGFQIPFFQEAKKLALQAAECVPMARVIGWDIAITPDGPIIIEGNSKPGIDASEISQNGFLNNPVFMELFEEVAESNNKHR